MWSDFGVTVSPTEALLDEVQKLVAKFGDSAAAATNALVNAVQTRFELLW